MKPNLCSNDPRESRVGIAIERQESEYSVGLMQRLVREALYQGGLGVTDRDSPMSDLVKCGQTVLLKPNWVLHYNKSGASMDCVITHPMFIEAVFREILPCQPSRILIADAPVQNAVFSRIVDTEWVMSLKSLGAAQGVDVEVTDLRKAVWKDDQGVPCIENERRPPDRFCLFDLARDSLLDPITTSSRPFRNTNYNPDDLSARHCPGKHEFLLCREPFEFDVVLNLPKLKSHKKSGITGALKNVVGLNGDKNYLPHHRVGGVSEGGDCYPGDRPLKRLAEIFLDLGNRRINTMWHWPLNRLAYSILAVHYLLFGEKNVEGEWAGNDTVWRMALDLNRIILFGDTTGRIGSHQRRRIYSITDGFVAGQGNGPLAPLPKNLGIVSFASSSAFADLAHLALMRFRPDRVAIVREAFKGFQFPLTSEGPDDLEVWVDGIPYSAIDIAERWGMRFQPPDGWEEVADGSTQ